MDIQDPQVGDRYIDRYGKIRHVVFREGDRVGYNIWAPYTMGGSSGMAIGHWRTLCESQQCRSLTAADVFAALEPLVAGFREHEGLDGVCALGCVEHMSRQTALSQARDLVEACGPER